jgi:sterol 3beta-glucosyltransferase
LFLSTCSFITSGSRGDIQPYLALALILKERGYNVRFLTNANFQEMIEPFGFGFCPIFPDATQVIRDQPKLAQANWGVDLGLKRRNFNL